MSAQPDWTPKELLAMFEAERKADNLARFNSDARRDAKDIEKIVKENWATCARKSTPEKKIELTPEHVTLWRLASAEALSERGLDAFNHRVKGHVKNWINREEQPHPWTAQDEALKARGAEITALAREKGYAIDAKTERHLIDGAEKGWLNGPVGAKALDTLELKINKGGHDDQGDQSTREIEPPGHDRGHRGHDDDGGRPR